MKRMYMLLAAALTGSAVMLAQTPQQAQVQALVQDMQQRFQQVQALDAGGRAGVRIQPFPAAETGKPFSATITTHTSQTYSDGTNVNHTTTVVQYRDTDGRTRMETDLPNGKTITIRDSVAGLVYILDTAAKTYIPGSGSPT